MIQSKRFVECKFITVWLQLTPPKANHNSPQHFTDRETVLLISDAVVAAVSQPPTCFTPHHTALIVCDDNLELKANKTIMAVSVTNQVFLSPKILRGSKWQRQRRLMGSEYITPAVVAN